MSKVDKLVNVKFSDGNVKRLPYNEANTFVNKGNAKFISHTLFKAAQAGVPVKSGQTDVQIKKAIKSAKRPVKIKAVEEKERQPQQRRSKKDRKSVKS